ncbi:rho guanine nucleotide exchange factor 33-like isoform X2 [Xyrauchen texanus]|uniref:rho guanine nucleotide exchange factor 33-like isoform X2 n=1 Tax=Xyrauchen texanus TaxID=154827 RepID=UPI002242813C|nr:rho guanine nucleotide exchange factor 33-like isoform X2 [Xyrauchen texanus]
MENGKIEGTGDNTDAIDLLQFQAMWLELNKGVEHMAGDVATLRQCYSRLEDKFSTYQQETSDKILSFRNTLNTLQEDISTALVQLSEARSNQKDLQRDLDLMQSKQHRKESRGEGSVDGHASLSSQTALSLIQHYISSLSANQNSHPEHDSAGQKKSPVWRERKNSQDLKELNNSTQRQTAALELLESERVYVSYLSLLLKANITFNGSENVNLHDKRLFPPSLRFLIQQHLELLHLLQERVLKSQWHGIMGDVFLRLTSKESDFLDHYVSYLRELPECLSVVSKISSTKSDSLLESDITGDETRPSLHSLLLQPVQRIPEYNTLLQNLLHQTESDHPDYYLLLVCAQQLRSFSTQYSHLLQHNQELLTHTHNLREHTHNLCAHQQERPSHTHKELSRSTVRQLYKVDYQKNYSNTNAQNVPQGLRRSKRYPDNEVAPYNYNPEIPSPVSFLSDSDSRHKTLAVPLRSIPETEGAGSAFTDALRALFPYGGGDSRCSSPSHSSDSSIDIAFVRCSPSHSPLHQSHSRGRSSGGVVYRSNRGCVSPDPADIVRPRPLQAVQRKSKSLNGLQMDSIDSHTQQAKIPGHPRLERQSSAKSKQRSSSPKHRYETHTDTEEQPRLIQHKDPRSLVWEELKLRAVSDDYDHIPLSERGRKEGKGFRSSFKKLFKKKSGGDGKERATLKAESQSSGDLESNRAPHTGDIDKGTAV